MIETLSRKGLSISYARLRVIINDLANSVILHWHDIKTVVPLRALKGVFTTHAVDNIDHNPSSTTARGSLHGTCASVQQHPTTENPGVMLVEGDIMVEEVMDRTTIESLLTDLS